MLAIEQAGGWERTRASRGCNRKHRQTHEQARDRYGSGKQFFGKTSRPMMTKASSKVSNSTFAVCLLAACPLESRMAQQQSHAGVLLAEAITHTHTGPNGACGRLCASTHARMSAECESGAQRRGRGLTGRLSSSQQTQSFRCVLSYSPSPIASAFAVALH